MRLVFQMIPKKSLKQIFLLSTLIMLLPKNLLLLSAALKLSSNNPHVWPNNMFKLPLLTNIKFLLLLGNNSLLLKFQPNFQDNGFLKDTRIFILVLFGQFCLTMAAKVYLLQPDQLFQIPDIQSINMHALVLQKRTSIMAQSLLLSILTSIWHWTILNFIIF